MRANELSVLAKCAALGKKPPVGWVPDLKGIALLKHWFEKEWKKYNPGKKITSDNLKAHFKILLSENKDKTKVSAIARLYKLDLSTYPEWDMDEVANVIDGIGSSDKSRALYDFIRKDKIKPHTDTLIFFLEYASKLRDIKTEDRSEGVNTMDVHPFVSRKYEMQQMHNYVSDTKYRMIILGGISGYGKTALLNNFIKEVTLHNNVGHITRLYFKEGSLDKDYLLNELKEGAFVANNTGRTIVQYNELKNLSDWLALLSGKVLGTGKKHLIILDGFEYVLNKNLLIKDGILEDFIEFVIRVRETDAVLIITTNTLPVFRSRITAWHSNRIKRMEIGALPVEDAIIFASILDNDVQCPCGIKDMSKKELTQILNTCGCRPATIIELVAYLKNNGKRIEELGLEFVSLFALKHQGDIFRRLNNKQKDMLKFIAACEHPPAEGNLIKQLPAGDIEAVAASLRSVYLIKAESMKAVGGYILHPLMKKYIEISVLKRGGEG